MFSTLYDVKAAARDCACEAPPSLDIELLREPLSAHLGCVFECPRCIMPRREKTPGVGHKEDPRGTHTPPALVLLVAFDLFIDIIDELLEHPRLGDTD